MKKIRNLKRITLNLLIFTFFTSTLLGNSNFENKVLNLINHERKIKGLKPLKINKKLSSVAQIKSNEMEEKKYFSHTSPKYGTPFKMMDNFQIRYMTAAENIAHGQETSEKVVKAWMNSPGHRKNILNPKFDQMGIGKSKNEPYYWVQMFIGGDF